MNKLKYLPIVVVVAVACLWLYLQHRPSPYHPRDYAEIAAEGVLRATMEYNSLGMYADKDSVGGFYYELLEAFARDHHLQVSITLEMSEEARMKGLTEGRFDLIASGMATSSELLDTLLLTSPILLSRLVLVQRAPLTADDSAKHIRSQIDLAGKTIHITKNPSIIQRLRHLSNEIGDTILVQEETRYGNEQLLALVAHGDIDYTVCEESLTRLFADSLPQLDTSVPIGFTQFYAWAVNKHSPVLLDSLNAWLKKRL